MEESISGVYMMTIKGFDQLFGGLVKLTFWSALPDLRDDPELASRKWLHRGLASYLYGLGR